MPISLEQFRNNLRDSGLIADEDLQALLDALPAENQPTDGEALARELVRQKLLTPFQAQQIYAGKGKSLVLGNYIISDKLGQGGMGLVFKACHRLMKRVVALKVLPSNVANDENAVKRFLREVEAAAKLSHPNIVAAHDADRTPNGILYLIMEFVEGRDLSALIKAQGPTTVAQATDFILQAARGLDQAHKSGVIHRDIKPANLLLDKQGTVKILDMGLARIEDDSVDAASQAGLTGTGTIMGTIDYMAPEQAEDTKHAGPQADIYSLGASLYFLLTAKPMIRGQTIGQKLKSLMTGEGVPTSIRPERSEVPEPLDAVFRKMVAHNLSERYQTMSELISDLEAIHAGKLPASMPAISATPAGVQPVSAERSAESAMQSFLRHITEESSRPASATRDAADGDFTARDRFVFQPNSGGTSAHASAHQKFSSRNQLVMGGLGAAFLLGALIWGSGVWSGPQSDSTEVNRQTSESSAGTNSPSATVARHGSPVKDAGVPRTPLPDGPAGELAGKLTTSSSRARQVVAAPDGIHAAISVDYGVQWKKLANDELVWNLPLKNSHGIYDLAISADGKLLAAGGATDQQVGIVYLIRTDDGTLLGQHSTKQAVFSVAISPVGDRVAVGLKDGKIQVIDITTGNVAHTLNGHSNEVRSLRYSPDGRRLVSGSIASRDFDGLPNTLKMWNTADGREIAFPTPGDTSHFSICYTADGKSFVAGSTNASAAVYDAMGILLYVIKNSKPDALRVVKPLPAAEYVLCGGTHFLIAKVPDGKIVYEFGDAQGQVEAMDITPDGRFALSTTVGLKDVSIWRMPPKYWAPHIAPKTSVVVPRTPLPDGVPGEKALEMRIDGRIRGHVVSADGRHFGVLAPGRIEWYDVAKSSLAWQVEIPYQHVIDSLAVSPDGRWLAAVGRIQKSDEEPRGLVWLLHTADGSLAQTKNNGPPLFALAFDWDGKQLAVGATDGTIRILEPETGETILELRGHVTGITTLAFAPDGTRLLSAARYADEPEQRLKLWDLATGETIRLATPPDETNYIVLNYLPNGRRFLAGTTKAAGVQLRDASGRFLGTVENPVADKHMQRVVPLPRGDMAVCSAAQLFVVAIPSLEIRQTFGEPTGNLLKGLQVTPDGRFAVTIDFAESVIQYWHLPKECWTEP